MDEIGYSKASIYQWRRKYIQKGRAALMEPSKDRKRGRLSEGEPVATEEISMLKEQVSNMQLEIDILKAVNANSILLIFASKILQVIAGWEMSQNSSIDAEIYKPCFMLS